MTSTPKQNLSFDVKYIDAPVHKNQQIQNSQTIYSRDYSKNNCINLNIADISNIKKNTIATICLDSGNQLMNPVMSGQFFDQLKDLGVIPSNVKLQSADYTVESADGSDIMIRGILKTPLKFYGNKKLTFVLKKLFNNGRPFY